MKDQEAEVLAESTGANDPVDRNANPIDDVTPTVNAASKENYEVAKIEERIQGKAFEKKDQSYLTASLDKFRLQSRQKVHSLK